MFSSGQLSYRFQAEIVCRSRRDRVSISPGNRLGYVGDRLRFGRIFAEVENCWGRKSSRKSTKKTRTFSSSKTVAAVLPAGARSTGRSTVGRSRRTVDRPGRPWCTNVHNVHRGVAVDPAGRPQEESGRPSGRPTEVTQLSVGNGRPARSTGA